MFGFTFTPDWGSLPEQNCIVPGWQILSAAAGATAVADTSNVPTFASSTELASLHVTLVNAGDSITLQSADSFELPVAYSQMLGGWPTCVVEGNGKQAAANSAQVSLLVQLSDKNGTVLGSPITIWSSSSASTPTAWQSPTSWPCWAPNDPTAVGYWLQINVHAVVPAVDVWVMRPKLGVISGHSYRPKWWTE